jgi:hypothetical protein
MEWIKKLFIKQSDSFNDVSETSQNSIATINYEKKSSIEFELINDGDINIRFNWKELYPEDDYLEVRKMAVNYAVLISIIDKGGFKNDMLKILTDSYKDNTDENQLFINMVLETLLDMQKTSNKILSRPMISPSKAFKSYEQK